MSKKTVLKRERVEKLFNFRPFLFGAVFFAFGIIFSFYYHFYALHAAWLLCVIPCATFPIFLCASKKELLRAGYSIIILCACFLIGFFGLSIQINRYESTDGTKDCFFTGRIVEMRVDYDEVGLVLDDVSVNGKAQNCKLIAYMPASFCENLQLSDRVFLQGDVDKILISADGFSVQAKDFGARIFLSSDNPTGRKIGHAFDLFKAVNARVRQVIDAGMDKTPAAVTKGVLLGDTTEMDSGLYNNIRYGGIAHIFAVSGLHVGSLFAFCLLLTSKTALRRTPMIVQFLLTASILFVYAGVCAFTASVVRASVMCLFAYLCKYFLVKSDFLETLGMSALVIMFFNPSALFTVGFQLSFAACFGIAFLSKPIGQVFDDGAKLYRKFFPMKLTEVELKTLERGDTSPPRLSTRAYRIVASFLSVSLGAQLFTAPFLLYYFGYVSGWALLLNCIFVPFISGIFSLLLVAVLLASILPASWMAVVLYVPNMLWSAVLLLFETADFTSFAIEGLQISASVAVLYLLGILFCTDKWNVRKSLRFTLASVCFCAFVVGMIALNL